MLPQGAVVHYHRDARSLCLGLGLLVNHAVLHPDISGADLDGLLRDLAAVETPQLPADGCADLLGEMVRGGQENRAGEAVVLSLCGGLLGIAAGFGIGEGISAVIGRYSDIPYPSAVSPASIAIALGISSAVGLFFGIYPAARASKLDPVAALGFE